MEPASCVALASSAGSLAVLMGRCIFTVSKWAHDTRDVDNVIVGFHEELLAMQRLMETLELAAKGGMASLSPETMGPRGHNSLALHVCGLVEDTRKVVGRLEDILNKFSGTSSSIKKQFRLSLESGDISTLRQRITLYTTMLGLPIQLISIDTLANNASRSTNETKNLEGKIDRIMRDLSKLHQSVAVQKQSHPVESEYHEAMTRADEVIEMIHGFTSNASDIDGRLSSTSTITALPFRSGKPTGTESTASLDGNQALSVYGPGISPAKESHIMSWIPPRSSPLTRVSAPSPEPAGFSDIPPGSSSNLEVEMYQSRLGRCLGLMRSGNHEKAAESLQKALKRFPSSPTGDSQGVHDEMVLLLAETYGKLGRSEDQRRTLVELAESSDAASRPGAHAASHELATIFVGDGKLDEAEAFALKAAMGRHGSGGSGGSSFQDTARLLVAIYQELQDDDEVDLWTSRLPLPKRPLHIQFQTHYEEMQRMVRIGQHDAAAEQHVHFLKSHYEDRLPWSWGVGECALPWSEIGRSLRLSDPSLKPSFSTIHFLSMAEPEAKSEVVYLLERGYAKLDATCKLASAKISALWTDVSPAMIAALCRRKDVLAALVVQGSDVSATDAHSRSVLSYAAIGGDVDVITTLVEAGADVSQQGLREPIEDDRDRRGITCVYNACWRDQVNALRCLIGYGASVRGRMQNGDTPIHYAAGGIGSECLKILVEEFELPVDDVGYMGETPLHAAAWEGNAAAIEYLLERGADVESRKTDDATSTPLHVAAARGNFQATRALLERGACVTAVTSKEDNERNLLTIAVGWPSRGGFNENLKIIEYLLSRFPDVCTSWIFSSDSPRRSPCPIFYAAHNSDYVRLLIDFAGPRWNAHTHGLIDNDECPLDLAIELRNVDNIRLLLQHGARAHFQTGGTGTSGIHRAAATGDVQVLKAVCETVSPKHINMTAEYGRTPLIELCRSPDMTIEALEYLLGQGASISATDVFGLSVAFYAAFQSDPLVLQAVIDRLEASRKIRPRFSWDFNGPSRSGRRPKLTSRMDVKEQKTWLTFQGCPKKLNIEKLVGAIGFLAEEAIDPAEQLQFLLSLPSAPEGLLQFGRESEFAAVGAAASSGNSGCLQVLLSFWHEKLDKEAFQKLIDDGKSRAPRGNAEEISRLLQEFGEKANL